MNPEDFAYYKKFLYEKSGLSLTEEKTYLLLSRLTPVARKNGFEDLEAMSKSLRIMRDTKLEKQVIDAMMTNETLFFRDDKPFKQLRSAVLPAVIKSREGRKSLRIWSAACSTGQEPYSIAMTILETIPKPEEWNITILATDLSDVALAQAMRAEFNQFEIQRGLPTPMVMKYFKQNGNSWKVQDKVRDMVRFENFNLLDKMDRFPTFDIIFCRNVLIYFDEETKKKILDRLQKKLPPDGFLFLGGAKTVIGICPDLKIYPACPGLYTPQTMTALTTNVRPEPGSVDIKDYRKA